MIAFDSYAKTSFEILIKSRIRSFLYQKMYKNADVFADIIQERAAYENFIDETAWFEKQQKLKPIASTEKCAGGAPCLTGQYCTRSNKCASVPAAAANVLKEVKGEYSKELKDYLKAETTMKGWYYSWSGGDALNKAPGHAINQWNGKHPKVLAGDWPWAKEEVSWSPAGSTKGPVKIGIGNSGNCQENGGTTPRDPEAIYNKLELWKNHMREYFYIVDGYIVNDKDEKTLQEKFNKDFRDPINRWNKDKEADVKSLFAMADCNKLWHFLWTPIKYANVIWKADGAPDNNESGKSMRYLFADEFDDVVGFGGAYKKCDQSDNSIYANQYTKCNHLFAAAESKYENKRNTFIPIKKEYNSLARAMGVDPDSAGFLGDLDFNGVLKLYNLAAYTIATLDGTLSPKEPKEETAEKQLKKMFIDVFEENIKLMGGSTKKSSTEVLAIYNSAKDWEISGDHPIEQKLAEYNILVDNAIYNIIEPIR